jgi:hypothetical protein
MHRLLLTSALALCLSILAGHSGARDKPEPPFRRLPAVQPGEGVVATLLKTVDFQGIDDPKATALEVFDMLSKAHRVTIRVNERAFAAAKCKDTNAVRVSETPIPPMRAPFHEVLRVIFSRVPCESGAAVAVRSDHLEITTVAALREEVWGKGHRGPFLPLVHLTAMAWELEEILVSLADQSRKNITLDPRAKAKARTPITTHFINHPLDIALFLLTDMAELSFVQLDGSFYVTLPERAAAMKATWARHRERLPAVNGERGLIPGKKAPRKQKDD